MYRESRSVGDERRRFRRSSTLLPAWAFVESGGERNCLRGVIRELSLNGAIISLYRGHRPIPELDGGTTSIELGFFPQTPGRERPIGPDAPLAEGQEPPLSFRCRSIRRLGRDGMLEQLAVRFDRTDSQTLFALKGYLRSQEQSEPWSDGSTALVMDDDDVYRMLLRNYLERMRYRVLEASNGKQGLDIFNSRPVKLVVVDVHMPIMDGLEVIQEVRRLRPDTRILAISSGLRGMYELLNAAKVLGASAILRKPFDRAMLSQTLRTIPCRRKIVPLSPRSAEG